MKDGDILTQQGEINQMSIIDNLLFVSTYGATNCIIEQGRYYLEEQSDNTCIVQLAPLDKYSLLGLINKRLLLSYGSLYSPKFTLDGTNYIYARYLNTFDTKISNSTSDSNDDYANVTNFDIYVSKNKEMNGNNYLLLCTVDFNVTEDKEVFSNSQYWITKQGKLALVTTDDKVYAKNLLAHASDHTNPHGKVLFQNHLKSQKIVIHDNPVYGAIYQDVLSPGQDNYVEISLPSGFKPMFVSTTSTDTKIGLITVKYGKDIKENDNKILIYNDGQQGLTIHVKIEVDKNDS